MARFDPFSLLDHAPAWVERVVQWVLLLGLLSAVFLGIREGRRWQADLNAENARLERERTLPRPR
ncbi:hypothetical protein [Hymenobacter arizonensis]|uniref:Uncharacterized protein n=1 Tax=Hymenobacter arizonensis TaxID=1227077 RepID=A0A1I6BMN1_HYMAR|nr:hypothetical protein [Hymenobacter arizonensis]SFQ82203.1 hypothetical protein SAMN04515668_4760 [Hymenobacter arizonensis]